MFVGLKFFFSMSSIILKTEWYLRTVNFKISIIKRNGYVNVKQKMCINPILKIEIYFQ